MPFPTYDIATETPNGQFSPQQLHDEIVAGGPYSTNFDGVIGDGSTGQLTVVFDAPPTGPEQATIDAIVGATQGDGIKDTLLALADVAPLLFAITSDPAFEPIGAITKDMGDLEPDPTKAVIEASCAMIVASAGPSAELQIVQIDIASGTPTVLGTVAVGDTGGSFVAVSFRSTVDPDVDKAYEYRLEGRLNGAASASVEASTLSFLRCVPDLGT